MKQIKIRKFKKGFSIIEMVAVTGIVAIISIVVSTMLVSGLKTYRTKRLVVDAEEKIASVMRAFEQTTRAASQLGSIGENQLTFYRFYDLTSVSPTQVRYFLDGNQFKIGLTQPSGIEPNITYPASSEQVSLIIPDVNNPDHLFDFYNGNNDLLSGNISLSNVKMIRFTISIDKNGVAPPGPTEGTTKVMLRNMKSNL